MHGDGEFFGALSVYAAVVCRKTLRFFRVIRRTGWRPILIEDADNNTNTTTITNTFINTSTFSHTCIYADVVAIANERDLQTLKLALFFFYCLRGAFP